MKQLTVLDLFSGIGGFSLGLERTGGFKTIQFVEIEPFCQKVLKKHWPEVPIWNDIKNFHAEPGFADVICGGFPCQDISTAGKGEGIEGARSGLWKEYARLIGEIRPRFVLVENVSALLGRGLGVVLGDLAALGYDAEWHCIPASAVGAPHRRDRVWILAHPDFCGVEGPRAKFKTAGVGGSGEDVAHAANLLCDGGNGEPKRYISELRNRRGESGKHKQWAVEPNVGRVAHGVPSRVDRLKSLGNAVVPQIPELLGNAILESL